MKFGSSDILNDQLITVGTSPLCNEYCTVEDYKLGVAYMLNNKNSYYYFQKASIYDMLSSYFKYSNPTLFQYYYLEHLNYLNKGFQFSNREFLMDRPAGNSIIRIIHAAPEAGNVDIYLNGNKILKNFHYKQLSSTIAVQPGKHQIDLYIAGNATHSILSKRIVVEDGKTYSLVIIEGEQHVRLLTYPNEPNVPHNETKFRFIHLSPDAPPVDVAVHNGDVVFENVSYKHATNYLALTPMTVDLEIRISGTKQIALPLPKRKFTPNEAYTILAVGYTKGKPELDSIIVTD